MTKLKLSDSFRTLTAKLQAITGGELEALLELETPQVRPGGELLAKLRVRSPLRPRHIDYVQLNLEGQIQAEGRWQPYRQTVETAQERDVDSDHELLIPLVIVIPENAVLTADGAVWHLAARAAIDRAIDSRVSEIFEVVP